MKKKQLHISSQDEQHIRTEALNAVKEYTDNCIGSINNVAQEKCDKIASKSDRTIRELEYQTTEYQTTIASKADKKINNIREETEISVQRIVSTKKAAACKFEKLLEATYERNKATKSMYVILHLHVFNI